MNDYRRACLVLLLSLILPLQSLAGLLQAGEICPPDYGSQQQMDCCDEMNMPAGNPPCLDMLKCSTASLPLLDAQRLKLSFRTPDPSPLWLTQTVLPSQPLAAPWRPPRV
ncbi:hypothetical protein [Pseudomonas leptonychotis]|jgi:hypothetical protein|uniref:DUF2946 domain-containing protein n=1 Tax=Pseudomonas leptonychotis TaxID=2448482 RepID=A0A4T1ZZU8_9PSED|nr:hypothetical protein [Pseudomonas leptonychotis]TIH09412.1 hypothetical protein D8779_01440 [Pseudomonas leptonychotis]|tara:strand:- start:183 stop:512 length:330 start_codon:yes stop_codon:yes gene_type:complete